MTFQKCDRERFSLKWVMGSDGPQESCVKCLSAVSCAKMAEPIDLLFVLWTRVGRGSTTSIVNTIEPSVCGGDAPYVKLL